MPSDEELLAAVPEDPQAFGQLYARHERAVLRYMLSRTRDPELAADLCAETFAAALLSARSWSGHGLAVAWLWGVARNVLAASLRRARVEDAARRRLGMPPLVLTDAVLEEIRALEMLDGLPSDQAEAIRLHVIEDAGYDEIAAAMGCSQQVVRQRVSRGLRTLRARQEETT